MVVGSKPASSSSLMCSCTSADCLPAPGMFVEMGSQWFVGRVLGVLRVDAESGGWRGWRWRWKLWEDREGGPCGV